MTRLPSILICLFVATLRASAASYYVAINGNDSNPGTQASPWLTVQHAASTVQTNDFVFVTAGAYGQYVTPANSGSQGTNITYIGIGQPSIWGFNMTGLCNWRIIGFAFNGNSNFVGFPKVNIALNVNHCTNYQILDNVFTNTWGLETITTPGSGGPWSSYGLIRSNYFFRTGLAPGIVGPPTDCISIMGTNNLIEYCDGSQCAHLVYLSGYSNIVRNCYYHDLEGAYFNNAPHEDFIHVEGPGPAIGSFRTLVEANTVISNCCTTNDNNGHFYLFENYPDASPPYLLSDAIIRKNVGAWIGGYVGVDDNTPNIRDYNNTYSVIGGPTGSGTTASLVNGVGLAAGATTVPTNFAAINGLYTYCGHVTNIYGTLFCLMTNGPPWYPVVNHNLTFQSGLVIEADTGPSLTNINPQLVNTNAFDYHLTNTSPCISAAGPQTTTTAGGSATTIVPVVDVGYFIDGWGMQSWGVQGDVVLVGTNAGVQITSINYAANTLTLASPVTFSSGAGVSLQNTTDIGAYDYDVNGYSYGITITSLTTNQISVTVTNSNKVRIVRFYDNGLEIGNANPASSVTLSASMNVGDVVQARAYALYADTNLVKTSSATIVSSLVPPSNLRIVSPN